jgi:serine/threonine protein kinase
VLAEKYRIGPVIGAGAMGTVVSARHLLLNENVAIKFLLAERWEKGDAVARFTQEARAAVRIQSEHVVRVLDVGLLEGGAPYIVMEYLQGADLATRLRRTGPLALETAVDFLLQACEALAEAHRLGIVHRDVKPANLFVLEREGAPASIKVLDFGVSKVSRLVSTTVDLDVAPAGAAITEAKTLLGSPFYMSPEQMESARDVDERTDVWALGVTLFELVTGSPPFVGSSLVQLYTEMVSSSGSHAWRAALARFPEGLEAVIARCLARSREQRYPTVVHLARALAPFGSERAATSAARIARQLGQHEMGAPAASPGFDSNPGIEKPSLTRDLRQEGRPELLRNVISAGVAGLVATAILLANGYAQRRGADAPRAVTLAAVGASVLGPQPSSSVSSPSTPPTATAAREATSAPARRLPSPFLSTLHPSKPRPGAPTAGPHASAVTPPEPVISGAGAGAPPAAVPSSRFDAAKIDQILDSRE